MTPASARAASWNAATGRAGVVTYRIGGRVRRRPGRAGGRENMPLTFTYVSSTNHRSPGDAGRTGRRRPAATLAHACVRALAVSGEPRWTLAGAVPSGGSSATTTPTSSCSTGAPAADTTAWALPNATPTRARSPRWRWCRRSSTAVSLTVGGGTRPSAYQHTPSPAADAPGESRTAAPVAVGLHSSGGTVSRALVRDHPVACFFAPAAFKPAPLPLEPSSTPARVHRRW